MFRNPIKTVRNRVLVVTMWLVVAIIVSVLFYLRLPQTHVHLVAAASNVMFRMEKGFPEGGPEVFSDWFVTGEDFLNEPKIIEIPYWNWQPGTFFIIGQSMREYPEQLAISAWGIGKVDVKSGTIYFAKENSKRWIFFGLPRLLDANNNLVVGANKKWIKEISIQVSSLAVRSLIGRALTMKYQAANPSPRLTAQQWETLKQESLLETATVSIMGKKISLNSGDALWLDGDVGELRAFDVDEDRIKFTYDAQVKSIFTRTGGKVINLMPTVFEYLMSFSILAQGISVFLGLGLLIFSTFRWWPNAETD